jgi:hypothetical protein
VVGAASQAGFGKLPAIVVGNKVEAAAPADMVRNPV